MWRAETGRDEQPRCFIGRTFQLGLQAVYTNPSLSGFSSCRMPLVQPSSGLISVAAACYQLHVCSSVHHLSDVLQGKAFGGHK